MTARRRIKTLDEINRFPEPEVRVPHLGMLFEHVVRSTIPVPPSVTLNELLKSHQDKFSDFRGLCNARFVRNSLVHGYCVTDAQISEAEISFKEAIRNLSEGRTTLHYH
jgi:hypothetical protein